MRKNVLALSIATMIGGLGFAGVASAAVIPGTAVVSATDIGVTDATRTTLSIGGLGHQLIYPYFTAQNGQMSVLHVVNTDQNNGKALKVRFRGAANSDDILDFYVLLSPGDVWTAAITADPTTGIARLETADTSCTYPQISNTAPQTFVTTRLAPYWTDAVKAANTREGYVEMFVAADIPGVTGTDARSAPAGTNLYKAVKHTGTSNLPNCRAAVGSAERTAADLALANALLEDADGTPTDGTVLVPPGDPEAHAAYMGFSAPTGGVAGSWYIIDVAGSTTFSGDAAAIQAIAGAAPSTVNGRANYVVFPQVDAAATTPDNFTADPLLAATADNVGTGKVGTTGLLSGVVAAPLVAAGFYDLPDLSTPYVNPVPYVAGPLRPREAAGVLSQALEVRTITNQYATDAGISAKTDWLFSMPSRRYSVAYNYGTVATPTPVATARVFSTVSAPGGTNQYFYGGATDAATPIVPSNTSVVTTFSTPNLICVKATSQTFYDREERKPGAATPGPVFSPLVPAAPTVLNFCGEANVLAFSSGNSALSATVARQTVESPYVNGYSVLNVVDGTTGLGLPIIGSSFQKITNSFGGTQNFGITWSHIFTR